MRRILLVAIAIASQVGLAVGDGFPKGQASPEGAACDLARAFIARDAKLFRQITLSDYGPKEYPVFLASVVKSMKAEAKKKTASPMGPKRILECYASRGLSKNGPASYGYATFGFRNVKFVDVKVELVNGQTALNRTLVIQEENGKWYVHPAPAISPLLSAGLNSEAPSTIKFKSSKT